MNDWYCEGQSDALNTTFEGDIKVIGFLLFFEIFHAQVGVNVVIEQCVAEIRFGWFSNGLIGDNFFFILKAT